MKRTISLIITGCMACIAFGFALNPPSRCDGKLLKSVGTSLADTTKLTPGNQSPHLPDGTVPGPAGPISGPTSVTVGATEIQYSIAPIQYATSYVWDVAGCNAAITSGSGTNSIKVSFPLCAVNGTISVRGANAMGNGWPSNLGVTVNPVVIPAITGDSLLCLNYELYQYTTAAGMSDYWWEIASGGLINSGSTTNSIMVIWFSAGNHSVGVSYTDQNGCTNVNASMNVHVIAKPEPAGPIIGPNDICAGSTGIVYFIDPVVGATFYDWAIHPGSTLISGYGTNSITLNFNGVAYNGGMLVTPVNQCGEGSVSPDFSLNTHAIPSGSASLSNMTVTNTQDTCRTAQTILAEGTPQGLLVQNGGKITLIASQKINLLPTSKVEPGGYLHGFITTNCQSCPELKEASGNVLPVAGVRNQPPFSFESPDNFFKIYPNPTTGNFTLEIATENKNPSTEIKVYSRFGDLILSEQMKAVTTGKFSVEHQPGGIYLVMVNVDGRIGTQKIIRIE